MTPTLTSGNLIRRECIAQQSSYEDQFIYFNFKIIVENDYR